MNAPLARFLVRLHATSWRRRYGNEFESLLAELPVDAIAIVDTLLSAFASRRLGKRLLIAVPAGFFVAANLSWHVERSESIRHESASRRADASPLRETRVARQHTSYCIPGGDPTATRFRCV